MTQSQFVLILIAIALGALLVRETWRRVPARLRFVAAVLSLLIGAAGFFAGVAAWGIAK